MIISTCDCKSVFSLKVGISEHASVVYHCHLVERMKIQGHLAGQGVLVNLHFQLGPEGHQNQDHLLDLYENTGRELY